MPLHSVSSQGRDALWFSCAFWGFFLVLILCFLKVLWDFLAFVVSSCAGPIARKNSEESAVPGRSRRKKRRFRNVFASEKVSPKINPTQRAGVAGTRNPALAEVPWPEPTAGTGGGSPPLASAPGPVNMVSRGCESVPDSKFSCSNQGFSQTLLNTGKFFQIVPKFLWQSAKYQE